MTSDELDDRIRELEDRWDAERELRRRTDRLVNRLLPDKPSAHGFQQPFAFVESARRRGDRQHLWLLIYAKLRAKADGGQPHIRVPKQAAKDGLVSPLVRNVAEELDADPDTAWARAVAYIKQERKRA